MESATLEAPTEIDPGLANESLGEAFGAAEPDTPDTLETPDTPEEIPGDGGLPAGTAWGNPDTIETNPDKPGNPEEKEMAQNDPPEFDLSSITDDQFDQLVMDKFGIAETSRDGFKSLKGELQKSRERIKELESASEGKANTADIDKLTQELEAVRGIKKSTAYDNEVMAPQAQALEKAKKIGEFASIDADTIEDLFRVENQYEAERQIQDLMDSAAESQLRPLVMSALEAREKGTTALKADDPVKELESWQARSAQINQEQQRAILEQETQMDKAALDSAFTRRISETPIGKTKLAQEIREQISKEIEAGQAVERDTVYEGLMHQRMFPFYSKHMTDQAREIQELKATVARLGGGDMPDPSKTPTQGARTPVGGLPPGQAWGS